MEKSDCFYLGHITRLHGLDGNMILFLDTDEPEKYQGMDSFLVDQDGLLVPQFINKIQVRKNDAIIELEDVGPEEAEEMVGLEVYLPLSVLPPLSGNKFYYHEVPGFKVIDEHSGEVGIITRVLDMPQQAVLQVDKEGKEVLIPVADDIILSLDRENKIMHVSLPEGLLDVYFS